MYKGLKVGIALEGGGAKGAYQVGVLKALKELDIQYECVVGTSIGALNATSYVVGDCEGSIELWHNTRFSFSESKNNTNNSSIPLEKFETDIDEFEKFYMNYNGLDPEPAIQLFKEIIDEKKVRASNINLGLTTYCLSDRKPQRLYIKDIPRGMLHEFVFASCYLPHFKPRPINGKFYLDGSFFSKLPLDMAVAEECDIIIAVRLRPEKYDYKKYNDIKIIDIAPDEFLCSTLEASQERIDWMIKKGYEDSLQILKTKLHPA